MNYNTEYTYENIVRSVDKKNQLDVTFCIPLFLF